MPQSKRIDDRSLDFPFPLCLDLETSQKHLPKFATIEGRSPKGRSAVSNKTTLFVAADGRSLWARRYRDIYEAHILDLGGSDGLSEAQLQMCRRAASLALEAERLEGRLADGDATVDVDLLGRLCGHLSRLYKTLGIKRMPREIGPTDLHSYLEAKRAAESKP